METLVNAVLFVMTLSNGDSAVVAQIDIEEGWHIYWENPGQSGYPTEMTGKCVTEMVYAPPHRFDMPGDIFNYGYDGRVLLFAKGNCAVGDEVTLSWLSCREDTCLPGELSASLQPLPTSSHADIQAQWDEYTKAESIVQKEGEWSISLKTFAHAEIEYFPTAALEAQGLEPLITKTLWTQTWQLKGPLPIPQSEKVVVRIKKRGKERTVLYTAQE